MNAHPNDQPMEGIRAIPRESQLARARRVGVSAGTRLFFSVNMVLWLISGAVSAADLAIHDCMTMTGSAKRSCLKELLERDPCDNEAVWALIFSYRDSEKTDELMSYLENLSDVAPDKARIHLLRALLLRYNYHDEEGAEQEIEIASGLLPCPDEEGGTLPPTRENAQQILKRGYNRFWKKDYAAAAGDIETYLRLVEHPDNPWTLGCLARSRSAMGDTQGAIDALTWEIELFPRMAVSELPKRAQLRRELGDETGADQDLATANRLVEKGIRLQIKNLDERIDKNPDALSLYLERARLRTSLRKYEGAIADCEMVIVLKPDSALGFRCRGDIRATLGDSAGAKADREHAHELSKAQKRTPEPILQ